MVFRIDFNDLSYLTKGDLRQQLAYVAISELGIMTGLSGFTPFLAGTIPLGIAVPESDLDIICYFQDAELFLKCIEIFKTYDDYRIKRFDRHGVDTIIASFYAEGFAFEIFGQPRPVETQEAYRHMLIEHEILLAQGAAFAQNVIALKQSGIKTEPAFAQLLGLSGDPYEALLTFDLRLLGSI